MRSASGREVGWQYVYCSPFKNVAHLHSNLAFLWLQCMTYMYAPIFRIVSKHNSHPKPMGAFLNIFLSYKKTCNSCLTYRRNSDILILRRESNIVIVYIRIPAEHIAIVHRQKIGCASRSQSICKCHRNFDTCHRCRSRGCRHYHHVIHTYNIILLI